MVRGINKFKGDAHTCVCHSKRVLNMQILTDTIFMKYFVPFSFGGNWWLLLAQTMRKWLVRGGKC